MLPELTRRARVVEAEIDGDATESVREGHRIARAIVAQAMTQARDIERAAREEGLEIGTRIAVEQEGESLRSAAAALRAAILRVEGAFQELQAGLVTELPRMAVAVAERILRHELSVRPETLALAIRDALGAVLPAIRIEIRLHPDDIATVDRHRDLFADLLGSAELRLEGSPDVDPGECSIGTEALTLAAGPFEQLERALALLTVAEEHAS